MGAKTLARQPMANRSQRQEKINATGGNATTQTADDLRRGESLGCDAKGNPGKMQARSCHDKTDSISKTGSGFRHFRAVRITMK
jgi:hypothetical protein